MNFDLLVYKKVINTKLKRKTPTQWRRGGSNPRPFTCEANALPLSYIPTTTPPGTNFKQIIIQIILQKYYDSTDIENSKYFS